MDLISRLKETFEDDINSLGYELVDIEFVSEAGDRFLRFFIYKEGGVTVEDCEKVSGFVDEKLDELDLIKSSYYLEVSSPDLSRPLKTDRDLIRNKNELLEIKLKNGKTLEGMFKDIDGDNLVFLVENEDVRFARNEIKTIVIKIVF